MTEKRREKGREIERERERERERKLDCSNSACLSLYLLYQRNQCDSV